MTNTTTDAKATRPGPTAKTVLLWSLIAQVALVAILWLAEPLRKSQTAFDPNATTAQAVLAKERNKIRLKNEAERRKKMVLREEDAKELKRRERKKKQRELGRKLEDMRKINQKAQKTKAERLDQLKNRSLESFNRSRGEDLLALCRTIISASHILRNRSKEPLAKTATATAESLEQNTISFISSMSESGKNVLIKQAQEFADPVKVRASAIEPLPKEKKEELGVGLFVHDSHYLVRPLDNFRTYLELLNGFDDAFMEEMNETPTAVNEDVNAADPIDQMSLEDVINEIAEQEQEIQSNFDDYRAAELAAAEGTSFDEASQTISEMRQQQNAAQQSNNQSAEKNGAPSHAGGIKTIADLNAFRAGLNKTAQGATKKWVRARNIAQQMGGMSSRSKTGQSAKPFQSRNQKGASGRAASSGGSSASASDGGSKSARGSVGGQLATINQPQNSRRPQKLQTRIPLEAIKAKALPGRRFSKNSTRSGWLYLDSWYVIGPWENNGKLDYTRTHPPELSVDFDARYPNGKIDKHTKEPRILRWQFIQSDTMRLTPPDEQGDSTYYAFTEVYFDEPTEMLLAIASDDAARMWVNDKLVWEDHGQSAWNLNEGFKRIRFNKGFNKFLVRIENGPVLCEYSVLLCPPSQIRN